MHIAFFHRGGRVFPAKVGPVPPILAASFRHFITEMFRSPPPYCFCGMGHIHVRHVTL
jgi:hypothetical protein